MDIIETVPLLVVAIGTIATIGWWTYKLNRDLRLDLQNGLRDLRNDVQRNMDENQNEMRRMLASHVHSSDTDVVSIRLLADRQG